MQLGRTGRNKNTNKQKEKSTLLFKLQAYKITTIGLQMFLTLLIILHSLHRYINLHMATWKISQST